MENGKRHRVKWSPEANKDVREIVRFVMFDRVSVARKLSKLFRTKVNLLRRFPFGGRIVPEYQAMGETKYRELIVKAWRVVYYVEGQTVHIAAVIDSRRDFITAFVP